MFPACAPRASDFRDSRDRRSRGCEVRPDARRFEGRRRLLSGLPAWRLELTSGRMIAPQVPEESEMSGFDEAVKNSVPGGSLAKPIIIALGRASKEDADPRFGAGAAAGEPAAAHAHIAAWRRRPDRRPRRRSSKLRRPGTARPSIHGSARARTSRSSPASSAARSGRRRSASWRGKPGSTNRIC